MSIPQHRSWNPITKISNNFYIMILIGISATVMFDIYTACSGGLQTVVECWWKALQSFMVMTQNRRRSKGAYHFPSFLLRSFKANLCYSCTLNHALHGVCQQKRPRHRPQFLKLSTYVVCGLIEYQHLLCIPAKDSH